MDGRTSWVRILPHAASAGPYRAHFKPNPCELFNFDPNVEQSLFSTQVNSMVSIPLKFAASTTRRQSSAVFRSHSAYSENELHICAPCEMPYKTMYIALAEER